MKYTIGIVGNGFVGSAVYHGFSLHADILIYDKNPSLSVNTLDDTVNGSDFIFVSVPTPMRSALGGEIDLTIMDSVMEEISRVARDRKIVIVKSTVIPGTVEKYRDLYPNLGFVFSPEFLTERTARLDFINAARIILGGIREDVEECEKLFRHRFPHTMIVKTDLATAQFVKYMCNCFFATKVSFMNEMYQIGQRAGVDWHSAMAGFTSDGRIGNSHLDVPGHDGDLGFGGKCFPKDINAMINFSNSLGVEPSILSAAWKKNLEVRKNLNWTEIKGAVSSKED